MLFRHLTLALLFLFGGTMACDDELAQPAGDSIERWVLPQPDADYRLTDEEKKRLVPGFEPDQVEDLISRYHPDLRAEILPLFVVPEDPAGPYLEAPPEVPAHSLSPKWDATWAGYWRALTPTEAHAIERSVADPSKLAGWSVARGRDNVR